MKFNNKYFIARHGHSTNLLIKSRLYYFFTYLFKDNLKRDEGEILTKKGISQIKNNTEYFKEEEIDLIFSSSFKRAKQTAEIIANQVGCQVIFDESFIEKRAGEKIGEIRKRVLDGFVKINNRYKDKKILIVSHKSVLAVLEGSLKGMSNNEIFKNYIKLGLKPGGFRELK